MRTRITLILGASLLLTAIRPVTAEQQLDLEGMSVFGNRELPKALFIVPWKDPEAGQVPGRPVNSLVDEALQPVDPDVFRRKIEYFETVRKTN